jgi:DNA-binding NarL/FixJ family response regulator
MNYLYAPRSVATRNRIFREIGDAIGDKSRLEIFDMMAGVLKRLKRFDNPEIVIMLAIGKKDVPNLIALRESLRDAAVIIMLSDEDSSTRTEAVRMRPKFLGMMDGDLDKIVPIVKKLVCNSSNTRGGSLDDSR